MASTSNDDFITVVCTSPIPIQPNTTTSEILISVENILTWDMPAILCHQTIKIQAHRNRLIQHSSYFHGLLSGSFSESRLDCIAIEWNLEAFINIFNCIYGCPLKFTSSNFLPFFEVALYFGVEMLLMRCKTWFSEVESAEVTMSPQIQLDDLVSIWSFSLENGVDFLPELCASYLARNFMWAISLNYFVDIPHDLLLSCVKHMNLTVDSEMHLSKALLVWLDANIEQMEGLSRNEDVCTGLLKQKVNLSSCPQITSAVLLMSLLPSSDSIGYTLRSIEQSPFNLQRLGRDQCSIILNSLPILSFEAVQEVDISKCPRLHLDTAIECFCKSFPSLRTLKAAFLLNFKISTLNKLVRKCRRVCEDDLTIDTSPITSSLVSVVSSSPDITPQLSDLSLNVADKISSYNSGLLLAKLTLEGRSDLGDSDLQYISTFCASLQYLNLKGCKLLTDGGIASLLRRCIKLHSVLVCDTSFGMDSVLALCSSSSNHIALPQIESEHLDSLAFNLQKLHMGSCKCVDETSLLKLMSQMQKLKSLCLSDTHLCDGALYSFRGSSLEMLDVSNTMVSKGSLAHLISGNPGLKCLKARGCRNLSQQESDAQKGKFSSPYSCRELHIEIGRTCTLEEISVGWGFSYPSLEALKPAITSLRKITVGLGGSLGEDGLRKLPTICPMLESLILYFQECGQVTTKGVSSLLGCKALEDLFLRHNGPGIQRSFISDSALKLPMLRKVSLDLCDASEGDFDIPNYADRYFVSTVKIARCQTQKGLNISFSEARRRKMHKETLVLVWNSSTVTRTVVKERL